MKEQDLGRGNRIIGFSSLEEMLEYQARQEAILSDRIRAGLPPEQEGITFGSYALRLVPVGDDTVLVIFGRVYSIPEVQELEIDAGAGILDGELESIMNRFRRLHADGYRYGRWFSEVCPDGEVGDAHITTLWPINEADYQHALNNGWECPRYLMDRVLEEMSHYTEGNADE